MGSFGKKNIPCYDPVLGKVESFRNYKGLSIIFSENSDAL